MLLTSLASTHATYWLIHRKHMNIVRAACLPSVLFCLVAILSKSEILLAQQATFFGGAFVAMSEPKRLAEKLVLLASLLFAVLFYLLRRYDFVHFHGGLGGTVGATAFVACLLVYGLQGSAIMLIKYNNNK
jgi:heme/copper-type cytochrome/quinol oxidase subunit 3